MSTRNPPHDCDVLIPDGIESELHWTQAGAHRHVCIKHAYRAGYDAAVKAVQGDRRRSSWRDTRETQRCVEGNAAPVEDIEQLPQTQGDGRHRCAICAWCRGWRDGVRA
ncbi:hypothetical protein WMF45_13515 [Sorangium sp. So ce448]|uniref:hypothetical protein n=1 Tax=Sorangium sp. So ce448 TaxID=3133314 RepID=UPI003F6400DC